MSLPQKLMNDIRSTPIPISTPDLIAIHATDMINGRHKVWNSLRYLEKKGLIKKFSRSSTGTKWTAAVDREREMG